MDGDVAAVGVMPRPSWLLSYPREVPTCIVPPVEFNHLHLLSLPRPQLLSH